MADEVVIQVKADTKEIDKDFQKVDKSVKEMAKGIEGSLGNASQTIEKQFKNINNTINKVGIGAGAAFAAVSFAIKGFIGDFIEADQITKQLENSFQNLGPSAGISIRDIDKLASEIQDYSKFSDTAVKQSANLLLSLQNLSGPTVLRAQMAIADLAAKMGKDLPEAAVLVGKALENPIQGLSALGRASIYFTGEQEKTIKTLVETGQVAEAQNVILGELEKRFQGAAEASGKGGGAFINLKNALSSISEEIGKVLVTQLEDAVEFLKELFKWVKENKEVMDIFARSLIVVGKAALVFATVAAGAKAFQTLNTIIPISTLLMNKMATSMTTAAATTKLMKLAVVGLVGATGLGLLIAFLPEIIQLLKQFGIITEKAKVDPKNFTQVADQLNAVNEKIRENNAEIKKLTDMGYGWETGPLKKQTAALEEERKKLEETKKALQEAHDAGKKVEGFTKIRKTPEEIQVAKKEKEDAAKAGPKKSEEQIKYEERLKLIAQENAALVLQRDFEVKTRKSTTETIKALDEQAAFTKSLNQTKETEAVLKNIEDQKKGFEKSLEDRKQIELKYLQESAKLEQEAIKAKEIGGKEGDALLENISIKKQILDEAHKEELAKNAEYEAEKRRQSLDFINETRKLQEEQKAFDDELKAEQRVLEQELGRTLREEELETLRLHLEAKRNLEKEGQNKYLTDVLNYGKTIADAKKTFQSQEMKDTAGFFQNLGTLTKGGLKELGLLNKAFKIKDVIIDTAAAISKANAVGFPANIPAIAMAASTGAVQLATITSTGFAQGGIVTGGIPGVDSVPAMLQRGEIVQPERNFDRALDDKLNARGISNTSNNNATYNFNVEGNIIAEDDNMVDRLIEKINVALEFRNAKLYGVT